jgi:hypothetical protein
MKSKFTIKATQPLEPGHYAPNCAQKQPQLSHVNSNASRTSSHRTTPQHRNSANVDRINKGDRQRNRTRLTHSPANSQRNLKREESVTSDSAKTAPQKQKNFNTEELCCRQLTRKNQRKPAKTPLASKIAFNKKPTQAQPFYL